LARAHQVIQDDPETSGEVIDQITPHGLIAAKAVGKDQRRRTFSKDSYIVAMLN
jgi:hypothetical protein